MGTAAATATASCRLAEIAKAVRIRSLTEFEFKGRVVECPPPLPRRFPPLPMVDRLQAELYMGAYCTRLDSVGFPAEEDAAGRAGGDMLAALSAANASRTRVDPDWLVLESEAAAVTVTKRGIVRRIPPTEILADAASDQTATVLPQPGRLVAITLPREQPEEGGFYFALGETIDSTLFGRPAVRFYWNVPVRVAPELMAGLTRLLNSRGIPFAYKCPRRSDGYQRFDSGTLFVARPWHDEAAAALPELHAAFAGRLRPDVPLFAKRLRPGLGFAEDPGPTESFGMSRCRLLAEGFWTAFARSAAETHAVLEELRVHLATNGIDLAAPYLNPWSVDRYDHGAFA
jgi:hypothetical protein